MNGPTGAPATGLPTLTEVVAWPAPAAAAPMPLEPAAEALPLEATALPPSPAPATAPAPVAVPVAAASALPSEDQLAQRVLADLQRQIELMLDYRMREVLAPILTRATDAVIRDARSELASTLRDVVARAVTQELARHRDK